MAKSNLAVVTHLQTGIIDRCITGVIFTSAPWSNPQGGAEVDNNVRVDPDTGHHVGTPAGMTRKIRTTVAKFGLPIFAAPETLRDESYSAECKSEGVEDDASEDGDAPEGEEDKKAKKAAKKPAGKKTSAQIKEERNKIRAHMNSKFWDIRAFGQVLGKPFPDAIRGVVRVSFTTSVDPVRVMEYVPTSVSGIGKEKGMGRATVVPYALLRTNIYIDPFQAVQNGFTYDDFRTLKDALYQMYDRTNSATRQLVLEKQVWFTHGSARGTIPKHVLERRVTAVRKDVTKPARSIDDYVINVDRSNLPDDITIEEII